MPVVSCLEADKPVLVGKSCILLLFFTIFLIMTANIVKQVMEVVKDYNIIYDKSEKDFRVSKSKKIPGWK